MAPALKNPNRRKQFTENKWAVEALSEKGMVCFLGLLMLQQNGFSGSSLIWGLEHGQGIYYIILSYSILNTCIYIYIYIFIHMYASFIHSRDGTFLRNLLTSWEIGCLKIAVLFCPEALQIGVPSWCDKPMDGLQKKMAETWRGWFKRERTTLVLCITR